MRGEEVIPAVEDNLITFTPLTINTQGRGQEHPQQEPKEQRSHRRRVQNGTWRLNQKQFNLSRNQEISHISPVEQVNGFNIEEPSVSYLQLPMGKTADQRVCSKCGNPGHWRKYCQSTTWCRFCTSGTHATRACKRYSNFVKDNPIASSRRTTPEHPVKSQQGFPQPPTQHFQAPVIPSTEGGNQRVKQPRMQPNSQDVRTDPHFRHPPPHYSQIPLHRQIPPVEVNELGPTIQQGVIQRPRERTEGNTEGRLRTGTSSERLSERNDGTNIAQSSDTRPNVRQHNIKVLPEGYQLALNETVRPVFVNHYYAGEAVVSGTNRRYIRLDDCDVLSESVQGIQQTQAVDREFIEHSRESLPTRCPPSKMTREVITEEERPVPRNVGFHRKFSEQSQNSLKGAVRRKTNQTQASGAHGEYRESSQHSPDTMNVGKSRVQAANRMDPKHVPLTGYEHYHQEIQTYPVNREPLNVQPTTANDNSALLDLPNVQTGLPEPLIPHQVNPPASTQVEEGINNPAPMESNSVTNTQILESIQNITKVMQQQLIFNGKTTEAGILQTASLFQEMIKAQEKRDLDPCSDGNSYIFGPSSGQTSVFGLDITSEERL